MLNRILSGGHLSGDPATGVVFGVTARQTGATEAAASWACRGRDLAQNVWYLIYLNGRFSHRVPGSVFNTNMLTAAYDTHDLQVLSWRRDMQVPEEWYGARAGIRAHIEWPRDSDTSISKYEVSKCATEGGTYEVVATKDQVALQSGIFEMASGAECSIAGTYNGEGGHTNTLFTLTITNTTSKRLQITNDKDAEVIETHYVIGHAFTLFDGVMITISGNPSVSDTCSFLLGVQPYYDTGPLTDGEWFFKVCAFDQVGNPSDLSDALRIIVAGPPAPCESFEVSYDEDTDNVVAAITQSLSESAVAVNIYSNFCIDTSALLERVFYDWPLCSTDLEFGQSISDILLLNAIGKPAGTYRFVARAVTADGVEDGAAVEVTLDLPYHPTNLPKPFALTATPTAGGAVTLTWYAEIAPADWKITGLTTDPLIVEPDITSAGKAFQYTVDIDASDVGAEGEYTATVAARSVSGSRVGDSEDVTFTTDATPPAAPTGLSGVAF